MTHQKQNVCWDSLPKYFLWTQVRTVREPSCRRHIIKTPKQGLAVLRLLAEKKKVKHSEISAANTLFPFLVEQPAFYTLQVSALVIVYTTDHGAEVASANYSTATERRRGPNNSMVHIGREGSDLILWLVHLGPAATPGSGRRTSSPVAQELTRAI